MYLTINIDLVESGRRAENIKVVLDKFCEQIKEQFLDERSEYELRGECNTPVGKATVRQ